jgi:tetratricopeptide (TPR) repeat protein
VETLTIQRLTDEQIRALVSHMPEPVVSYIQTSAAGNPFFAEELARGVGASHFAPSQPAAPGAATTHETAGTPGDLHLPTTLPDTISAVLDLRLGRISSACQRLLVRAAVLGGSFEINTILAMEAGGPDADEDIILDLLEEALQAGMLTEEGSGTRITYYFWHPLLVSHLYDGLSAGRRASLHRRAAEVLRQAYQGREQEGAAAIVHHLANGGAESPQVAYYAELAGDRAYALSAYPEAERHYWLAVEHIGTLPAGASPGECLRLANLLERLGECTRFQGYDKEARRYFEQALEVHSRHHLSSHIDSQYEAQIEALLWCEIGKTWFDTGDFEQAQQCYSHSEQVLREAEVATGPVWASLYLEQSYILWRKGNFEEARQTALQALNIFENVIQRQDQSFAGSFHSTATRRTLEGDPVDLGRTNTLLAAIAATIGESTIALDHLNTALTIFEQYERQREIAMVCGNIGDVYLRKAEHTLAQAAVRRSLSIAEQIGDTGIISVDFGNLGILSARFGDLLEAEVYYRRALALAEQVNDPVYMSLLYSYLATIMRDQGKIDEAKTALCQALRISRAMNITPSIGAALVALGHLQVAQALAGQENDSDSPGTAKLPGGASYTHLLKRARIALQRGLALEGLEAETRTEGQLALAQASFLLGEIDTARQQAMQGMEEARRLEQTWLLACARRLMGEILSAQGQQEEAKTYFAQALEVLQKCGMRLEWARTLQGYGVALLGERAKDDGSYRQGLKYLEEAREVFRECNAVLDLRGVERVIDRYTVGVVKKGR